MPAGDSRRGQSFERNGIRDVYMTGRLKLIKVGTEGEHLAYQKPLPATEFRHFKNVTSNVMQDALNLWADLWGELQGQCNVRCYGTA